ncbi:MAG: hypothetical protein JWQ09_2853 [Segetibacter sp.]|nr:hypothetical protein [Segetibacter sp.]
MSNSKRELRYKSNFCEIRFTSNIGIDTFFKLIPTVAPDQYNFSESITDLITDSTLTPSEKKEALRELNLDTSNTLVTTTLPHITII